MSNRSINIIFLCTALFFFNPLARAEGPWVGTHYIYSLSVKTEYAAKIVLNADNTGKLVLKEGSADIRYENKNFSVDIFPTVEFGYETFETPMVPDDIIPEVLMVHRLKKFNVRSYDFFYTKIEVTETWERCYSNPNRPSQPDTCKSEDIKYNLDDNLRITDEILGEELNLKPNDNVVLPFDEHGYSESIFVHLDPSGDADLLMVGEALDSHELRQWVIIDNTLMITLDELLNVSYKVVRTREGIPRAVGLYEDKLGGTGERIFIGALIVDKKLPLSETTPENISGHYKPVLVSSRINQTDTLYSFLADGTGGYLTRQGYWDADVPRNLWSWSWEKEEISATHYFFQNSPYLNDREELEYCIAEGIQSEECIPYEKFRFKILQKSGNRLIILQQLKYRVQSGDTRRSLSVRTFYKL